MTDHTTSQARRNHDAYNRQFRESLEREHFGRVALMHDGEVVHVFNDADDAYAIGCQRYGAGNFSLVRVGERPAHLGVMAAMMR